MPGRALLLLGEILARVDRRHLDQRQISADWEAIEKAAGEHLINSIAMLCPFAPSEKQALLEAPDLDERARLLIALVEMAAVNPGQNFSEEEKGATRH